MVHCASQWPCRRKCSHTLQWKWERNQTKSHQNRASRQTRAALVMWERQNKAWLFSQHLLYVCECVCVCACCSAEHTSPQAKIAEVLELRILLVKWNPSPKVSKHKKERLNIPIKKKKGPDKNIKVVQRMIHVSRLCVSAVMTEEQLLTSQDVHDLCQCQGHVLKTIDRSKVYTLDLKSHL